MTCRDHVDVHLQGTAPLSNLLRAVLPFSSHHGLPIQPTSETLTAPHIMFRLLFHTVQTPLQIVLGKAATFLGSTFLASPNQLTVAGMHRKTALRTAEVVRCRIYLSWKCDEELFFVTILAPLYDRQLHISLGQSPGPEQLLAD
jgi:hypothetical protein